MVGLRFNVPREGVELILAKAREYAENNDSKSILLWEFDELELKVQDDYFNVDLPHGGWIFVNPEEFTSKHLTTIIEQKPDIVDRSFLIAILEALTKRKK